MFELRIHKLDWKLMTAVLLLTAVGLLMIYSATRTHLALNDLSPTMKLGKQLVFVIIGLVLFVIIASFDYSRLANLSWPLFIGSLVLLVAVLVIGTEVNGARRWIDFGPLRLQPGELAKPCLILFLASYMAARAEQAGDFDLLLRTLGFAAIPCGLILIEPDLGTPVLLIFVWGIMCYALGSRLHHLAAIWFAFLMLFAAAWGFDVIRPHQRARLMAFVNSNPQTREEKDARYQLEQSMIAIGSGHLAGQGLFRGPQTQLRFVPDQETDFIFTAIGEELGFLGAAAVVALLGVVLWRTLMIAMHARTLFGRLIAAGVAGMFFLHILANIGMTLGMTPVKGMPLPFVSYGGSALMANFIALGVLQSIFIDRQTIRFD